MRGGLRKMLRRLALAGLVVVGVVTVAFVMARQLPGDPVRMVLGPQARPADVARARAVYALDEPATVQYMRFWQRLVHLAPDDEEAGRPGHLSCAELGASLHVDLGFSYRYRKPVVELVATKAPRSLELAFAALLLQALLGFGTGIFAASRRGSVLDQLATGASLAAVSAPIFAMGLALQYVLSHRLGLLPHDGYGETPVEQLRSLVLPALTLGIYGAAIYARLSRDEVSRLLAADFVRASRARGASRVRALVVHALRNAIIPLATLMVLDLGALIGGAIVTEKLFRWPGMGSMAVDAMINRDGPVIFGTVLFSAIAIVAASLLVDLVTLVLDPRQRE